jgi:hypothetical protein
MLVLESVKSLNVEQLPKRESGREVVHHQIGGKLKEIWKRLHHSGSFLEMRLSASMSPTEEPEVNEASILSISLR